MNKKILPENIQISEYNNLKKQESFLDSMEIFKSNKRDIRFLTAITLPLILAACGGGRNEPPRAHRAPRPTSVRPARRRRHRARRLGGRRPRPPPAEAARRRR